MIGGALRVHNGGGGRSDACDVLQKEVSRTASVGNVTDVEEQARPRAIKPGPLSGEAEVLARESRNDAIHCSTPCCSVEGEKVGPDRSWVHGAFLHARRQNSTGICFPLDVTHGASLDAQVSEPGSESFAKHAHS